MARPKEMAIHGDMNIGWVMLKFDKELEYQVFKPVLLPDSSINTPDSSINTP